MSEVTQSDQQPSEPVSDGCAGAPDWHLNPTTSAPSTDGQSVMTSRVPARE